MSAVDDEVDKDAKPEAKKWTSRDYVPLDRVEAGKLEELDVFEKLAIFPMRPILPDGSCSCDISKKDDGKKCAQAGAHPAHKWGQLRAGEKVLNPTGGYGIATGWRSGNIVVVDIDKKNGKDGFASIAEIEAEYGHTLGDDTLVISTPSGGEHWLFYSERATEIASTSDQVGVGVDIRADGGMVVAAGAPHRNGGTYRVKHAREPKVMPTWFEDLLIEKSGKRKKGASSATSGGRRKPAAARTLHPSQDRPFGRNCVKRLVESGGEFSALLSSVYEGEIVGTVGSRNHTLLKILGFVANRFPYARPADVGVVFAGTMAKIEEHDVANGHDVYDPDFVERTFGGLAASDLDAGLSKKALLRMSVRGGLNTNYGESDLDRMGALAGVHRSSLTQRLILVGNGGSHWVLGENGYMGPYDASVLGHQLRRYLTPFAPAGVELFKQDKEGKWVAVPPKQLTAKYGVGIDEVRADLRVSKSHLEHSTSEMTLVEAAGQHAVVEPVHHPDVDAFLRALSGDAQTYYCLFWALVFYLDPACAICAIWLTGLPNIGKSLFTGAVGQLFKRGKPVSGDKGTQRFNASIAKCPVIRFEETAPKDSRGNTDLDILKRLVTESSHDLEPKGKEVRVLEGYLRVLLTSNNLDMVKPDRSLTDHDIDAIAQRIIHVDCSSDEQARKVKSVLARHPSEQWFKTLIPQHIAWMQTQREHPHAPPPTGRLRTPAHADTIRTCLRRESGRTVDLILFFLAFLERHLNANGDPGCCHGIIVRDGKLFTRQTSLSSNWGGLMPNLMVPGSKQLRASWKRLQTGDAVSIGIGGQSRKFREVDVKVLKEYSSDNDGLTPEEIERALAIPTVHPSL